MSQATKRVSAHVLVLALAVAAPSAALVTPSYAGSGTFVAQATSEQGATTPRDFEARQYAANEISLRWKTGEIEPDSYRIELFLDNLYSDKVRSEVVDGSVTEATLRDVGESSYYVSITPITEDVEGDRVVRPIDVFSAPGEVRSFGAMQVAPGKVTLRWQAPEGPATPTAYVAGFSRGEASDGKLVSATARSTSFANLRPGEHTFRLRALKGTVSGEDSSVVVTVTNAVKRGAPTLSVADASLGANQELKASGRAPRNARIELELRPDGYRSFFVVGSCTAGRKGRWSAVARLPQSGTLRVVAVATGRVSAAKAVTVARP